MEIDRQSLDKWCDANRVTIACVMVDRNPNMEDDEWARTATHWKCRLTFQRRAITVHFSQGSAHSREPSAADVLGSLLLDSSGVACVDGFDAWCAEYGYDTDSRRAERTYRACQSIAKRLRRFLGDAYAVAEACEH